MGFSYWPAMLQIAGGIDSFESISELLKNLKLRALRRRLVQEGGQPHICIALSISQHPVLPAARKRPPQLLAIQSDSFLSVDCQ
jgi:hypothetical protein